MYARFFDPAKALAYYGKPSIYSIPIKVANQFYQSKTTNAQFEITKVVRFEPGWDSDWHKLLSAQYDFYGVRDSSFLNYKLAQPHKSYIAMVARDKEREIHGYIVFRFSSHHTKDLKLVRICDLVGTDPACAALIFEAVKFAQESHAYGIVALSSSKDEKRYRRAGLWTAKVYPIILGAGIQKNPQVTLFDSDLDDLW